MIPNIMLDIMARISAAVTGAPTIANRLRARRQLVGLSQQQLAERAGITRQAVSAVEANQYSPATSVSLHLARVLECRVEDLFSLEQSTEYVEAHLLGSLPQKSDRLRAQVLDVNGRLLVRAIDGAGELSSLTSRADGLIVHRRGQSRRVKVELLENRETLRQRVVIGGCDPAAFLAAEHLNRNDHAALIPCLMGNRRALGALTRGEIHVAGVHFPGEPDTGRVLTRLRRTLENFSVVVVTFAHWEAGLIVPRGNPRKIRNFVDLANPRIKMINREEGSGARRLLDREFKNAGVSSKRVKGYHDEVFSHLEVAARIKARLADAGVGVRAAAAIYGLDFVPLQRERYDWIIPKIYYETLPGLRALLDKVVEKRFRDELEALGGYDTREIGRVVGLPT